MAIEARQSLVWGTAAAAVVSAGLLASSGGGPRVAGLDAVRAGPLAAARAEALAPALRDGARAAPAASPAH